MRRFLCLITLLGFPYAVRAATNAAPASAVLTNEPTVITSDHMQGDYVSNFGTFEGNVVVVDSRGTVRADKMVVFFGGTNNIVNGVTNVVRAVQRVVADGGVVIITADKKKGTGDHADYTTADSKIILTGHPQVETSDGVVTGKKITIWQGTQKMDVEADETSTNRSKLLIYPQDQRKKDE